MEEANRIKEILQNKAQEKVWASINRELSTKYGTQAQQGSRSQWVIEQQKSAPQSKKSRKELEEKYQKDSVERIARQSTKEHYLSS